ncbi:MAG: hypothetical protein PHC60_10315, partial [Heliobacteriaceae bacterium]|nr:hypothetical protein [Heliobacteriaceae bacterium]
MIKNISRLRLSRPATLLVFLMIFAAFPAAVAAQTYTVVDQAPERVNVPFDRRVLVELPATFLAAGATDELYFQFPAGVTVKETGYQTLEPAFVNESGTAEIVDSRTGRIPVLGSGNAGKGLIVLSFQGITAGQAMADLAVEFFGPPGSAFSAARISLTGGSPPTPEPEENNTKGDEETPTPLGSFTIGEKQWILAGETRTMDVTPFLTEDRVFCPVRFAALLIGIPEQNIRW